MLNKCVLIGRLTGDLELNYTSEGIPVTNFTLAVNRNHPSKNGKDVDYIKIVAWRKLAEICAEYLKKGRLTAVVGKFRLRENEKNGRKYLNPEIVLDEVKFLDSSNGSKADDNKQAPGATSGNGSDDIDDVIDEINVPF